MTIIDLFSGIGGFSLAFDTIFHEQKNTHIFVEIDPFCQAVLKKHWPDSEIILEAAGYEAQAFVVPAVAVNAPHRRDRVWFVANRKDDGCRRRNGKKCDDGREQKLVETEQEWNAPRRKGERRFGWGENWLEVATRLCRVDDGIPGGVDEPKFSVAAHRTQRLKALGNAIVPQVAMEIMKAIKLTTK